MARNKIQTLAAIRPHLAELVSLLGSLEDDWENADSICPDESNPESLSAYRCLEARFAEFGIDLSLARRSISNAQYRMILRGFELVGERFALCLADTEYSSLLPEELVQRVLGTIQISYNPDARATTVQTSNVGSQFSSTITFAPSAFSGSDGTPYSEATTEHIVVHETGHAFHNTMEPIGTDVVEITPYASDCQPARLQIIVDRDDPQALIDYLNQTHGYWNPIGIKVPELEGGQVDFGDWYREDGYLASDQGVVPYRNIHTALAQPYERGALCLFERVVRSDCDPDVVNDPQRNGGRYEYFLNRNNQPIRDQNEIVYIRPPDTYIQGPYAGDQSRCSEIIDGEGTTDISLFINERDPNVSSPSPREGFADSFAANVDLALGQIDESRFPPSEPRRQFIDQNFCQWVWQRVQASDSSNDQEG